MENLIYLFYKTKHKRSKTKIRKGQSGIFSLLLPSQDFLSVCLVNKVAAMSVVIQTFRSLWTIPLTWQWWTLSRICCMQWLRVGKWRNEMDQIKRRERGKKIKKKYILKEDTRENNREEKNNLIHNTVLVIKLFMWDLCDIKPHDGNLFLQKVKVKDMHNIKT